MSDELGTYSFLPWLRHGIANQIQTQDLDSSVRIRAAISVDLKLTGKPVDGEDDLTTAISRDVALYGPGDIVGIDQRAIIKTEPLHWITNFEPNYLPYVEFYDEDFPWRYTPAAPDVARHRLRPWLALVVLKEEEFKDGPQFHSQPLAAFEIKRPPQDLFPPARQLWAWAHVHINKDLIREDGEVISSDMDPVLNRLKTLLGKNPDQAYSRILSPRKLDPDTGYHAFLVPTFESGRLAGLGLEASPENPAFFATLSAWAEYDDRPESIRYPYYYRWYFKTGTVGDFEHLVRLLKPRPPDSRLGRRDMDVQRPGANISGIKDPELEGVLRLGGALKVPDEALTGAQEAEALAYEEWDDAPYPHGFQRGLAAFINLAEDYAEKKPEEANSDAGDLDEAIRSDPDPLITPPLYGRWHGLADRLLFASDGTEIPQNTNWIHELNLDPRWRVPAGFGTAVIQDKQEEYMDAAWEQVGDIIDANRKIRQAQLAKEVSSVWYQRHLKPLKQANNERDFVMTVPVQRRVVAQGVTVHHAVHGSIIPQAAVSPAMRRITRPRDHVAKTLGFGTPSGPGNLLARINAKEVSAAPPKITPENLPTVEDVSQALRPPGFMGELLDWLRSNPWAKWAVLLVSLYVALVLLLFAPAGGLVAAGAAAAAGVGLFTIMVRLERRAKQTIAMLPAAQAPGVIDDLPRYPHFEISEPGSGPEPVPGSTDSGEAVRFKTALKDTHAVLSNSEALGAKPNRPSIDINQLSAAVLTAIDPEKTIPRFTMGSLIFPARIVALIGEFFKEAMAYPEFDTPMYKPLLDLSTEHFLPNIKAIKQNTITLLETNQRFIEAYMVGLNHEFARELLWREYPTDQRGSYFRQFWDVSGVRNTEGLSRDEFREKLKDIPPLHLWSKFSSLGDHDHREIGGDIEDELTVVIRGQLLEKFPNTVIYAQRARWQLDDQGEIDPSQERILDTTGDMTKKIKTPLYEAKVEPDIYFLGFDLTAEEVQGGSGRSGSTDPGWFFVMEEEPPGESRFGLDIKRKGQLNVWNDLAWPDVLGDGDDGFLQISDATSTLTLTDPEAPELQEKKEQFQEDKALRWHAGTNAAELAYILYQVPVRVAVHGSEMLPH